MNRLTIAAMALGATLATQALAQTDTTPNRIVLFEQSGRYRGYLTERIDSINFYNVAGEVTGTLEVTEVNETQCAFTATHSADAQYLDIAIFSDNYAVHLDDDAKAAAYIEDNTLGQLWDETYTGILSGLEPGSNYVLMVSAVDRYGIHCGVARAAFSTTKAGLVGNPQVTAEVIATTTSSFTVRFTPNADVLNYAYVAGTKGEWQQQYEQWGPMFGFKNFGDMIMAWGIPCATESEYTWTDFAPNTEYEVLIQATDIEGNYADYQTLLVTTDAQGGEGPSVITVTIGDFGSQAGKYYQQVICEPNENTAVYYDLIITDEGYNEIGGAEGVKGYLEAYDAEQYYPQYGIDDALWNAAPSTTYHACAMGKNALGEWGEMTDVTFTTPNEGAKGAPVRQSGRTPMMPLRQGRKQITTQRGVARHGIVLSRQ